MTPALSAYVIEVVRACCMQNNRVDMLITPNQTSAVFYLFFAKKCVVNHCWYFFNTRNSFVIVIIGVSFITGLIQIIRRDAIYGEIQYQIKCKFSAGVCKARRHIVNSKNHELLVTSRAVIHSSMKPLC